MKSHQELLKNTSTEWAPWYCVPADQELLTRASVSEILVTKIEELELSYLELTKEEVEIEKTQKHLKMNNKVKVYL